MAKRNSYPEDLSVGARVLCAQEALLYAGALLRRIEKYALPHLPTQRAALEEALKEVSERITLAQSALRGEDP